MLSPARSCLVGSLALLITGSLLLAADNSPRWHSRVIDLVQDRTDQRPPVISSIRLQPGGSLMAAAGDDHIVRVWDTHTRRLVHRLEGHTDWVRTVAFSPDGLTLATAGNDRRIILWDAASGVQKQVLTTHEEAITQIAYSHNGHQLAVIGFEDRLRIYEPSNGHLLVEQPCPTRDMRALAYSPDDSLLVAGGRGGTIRVFASVSGTFLRDLQVHRRRIRHLMFTADGQQIISCGEDQRVCVTPVSGEEGFTLLEQEAKVLAMAVYEPGRLATAGTDNVIRLWDLATRQEIDQLTGHLGSIATLESSDHLLVSGGYDTTVRLWTTPRGLAD